MTIITNIIRSVNNYFFDSDYVDGDAYLFYGVIALGIFLTIVFTIANIKGGF